MKRRGFIKGLLAAGALGLTLSAGGALRLEPPAAIQEKTLTSKITIYPCEDMPAMFGLDLEEKLAARIRVQMMKEWERLVAYDIRYMAKKVPWYRRALNKLRLA